MTEENTPERALPIFNILGIGFLAGACIICIYSFYEISNRVESALTLTGYRVSMPAGTEKIFGYGGDGEAAKVDVAFQGKEMSDQSFKIARRPDGTLFITPLDDRIRFRGTVLQRGDQNPSFDIQDGESFRTQGDLSAADMRVRLERDELRLELQNPLYREVKSEKGSFTRLVLDKNFTPIPTGTDEIFFRNSQAEGGSKVYTISFQNNNLRLKAEEDLAQTNAEPAAGDENSVREIKPGESINFGNLILKYVYRSKPAIFFHGIKLCLGMLFLGLAFLTGPRIISRYGFVIFGVISFLLSLGAVISARDFFFPPHQARFLKYVEVIFWCAIFLFGLRYPHAGREAEDEGKWDTTRTLLSGLFFVLAYCAFYPNFDQANDSILATFIPEFTSILLVVIAYFGVLVVTRILYRGFHRGLFRIANSIDDRSVRFRTIVFCCLPMLLCLFTWFLQGHQIMLHVWVIGRVYLPILLLPIMIAGALLSIYADRQKEKVGFLTILCLVILWGSAACYRLVTGDNGGTLVIAVGLFIAYALSIRPRIISVALAIVLITGGLFALRSSERFDLAWRPETAQLNYYDQAKNLRVARDMARAGGWDGKWFDLRLPGDVRNNIHNDLMSAYLAGFFGWIILAIVLFAYLIFYTVLWRTIGEEGPPDDETPEVIHSSSLMVAFCSAIVAAFFVQNLWVFIQPLQSAVPLIGLDLVPVSTSGSSVLSILIIVLGSVFFCQTLRRSLENDGFASLEKS